jgi:hypothetical protein
MMLNMKQRVSLSLDERRAAYLQQSAQRSTQGNASAYIERLLAEDEMRKATEAMVAWYAQHPSYAEDSVAEAETALDESA